ncbi:MAG: methylmalonyl-CoA mutase family protein [Saprospiraceae bacterium]|nr:methylmalonyl-CoA mutase family protein [Saprospiraceae bacterium]
MDQALHFDEFDPVSRQQWLERIHAELKNASPGNTRWQYEADLSIDPFVHAEDPLATRSFVPRTGPWQCGDTFTVDGDATSVNQDVLEALAGGIDAVHLRVRQVPDWDRLLRDIALDMIHLTIDLHTADPDQDAELFLSWLDGRGIPYQDDALTIRGCTKTHTPYAQTIMIPAKAGVIEGLVQALTAAAVTSGATEFCVDIGPHYFVEIARLRALRILYHNLGQALNRPADTIIETRVAESVLQPDIDQNLIRAGSIALSAILGGADRIYTSVVPEGQPPSSFHRRMARNIHHLFRYESHLESLTDPVSGAYYLEKLTRQIVEKVWERLAG